MEPGIYHNIPDKEYHALPYISSTFLKRLKVNPAAALELFTPSEAMVLGSAAHAFILEGEAAFESAFAVAPDLDKRTKEGKAQWGEFQAANAGKTIISHDQGDCIVGMWASLMAHPLARIFLKQSREEVTAIWDDQETGQRCKARFDSLPDNNKRSIIDLKTCKDSSSKGFQRQIVSLNYDIQAAWYTIGAQQNKLDVDTFIFIAVETSAPYAVKCGFLSPSWLEWAKLEAHRLVGMAKECKAKGYPAYEIPGHLASINDITPADLLEEWEMPNWR